MRRLAYNIRGVRRPLAVAMLAGAAAWPGAPALAQQCASTGANQTCTNSIFLTNGPQGILDTATLTVTNTATGTLFGNGNGLAGTGARAAVDANVTNFGTIIGIGNSGSGAVGVAAVNNANVTNYGSISAFQATAIGGGIPRGIAAGNAVNLINFGTVSASGENAGPGINTTFANVTNYGTIQGGTGINAIFANVTNYGTIQGSTGIRSADAANVTNAGAIIGIIGTTTAALDFSGAADTLLLLQGSRIVGAINLGGGGDTIAFGGGNHNLTFDTLAGASVSGNIPFVVAGNQIIAFDPTAFARADQALNDVTGGISGMIAARFGSFNNPAAGGGMSVSYAPVEKAPASGVPWPVTAGGERPTNVWVQGFGGLHRQHEDRGLLESNHRFYGGAFGADRMVSSNLWLGGFVGAGGSKLAVDDGFNPLAVGGGHKVESDFGFGGVYGRFDWVASFLDFAVTAGGSGNRSERVTNNNLVAGGLDTVKASYHGWFVSPEATYGLRIPFSTTTMLVPSAKVRYLAAWYDGYTESGASPNLTIDDRDFQTVEGRLQLALTSAHRSASGEVLRTNVYGGVTATTRIGDSTVTPILNGQSGLPFVLPGKDAAGPYGGAEIEFITASALRLFASVEVISYGNDNLAGTAQAGLRAAF